MKRIIMAVVIFCAGVAVGLILTHGPIYAQNSGGDPDTISRLNDIIKSQQELMTAINSIKEDLQIIKIRVTQMQ